MMTSKKNGETQIHELVQFLCSRSGSSGILIITDDPKKAVAHYDNDKRVYVTYSSDRIKVTNSRVVDIREVDAKFLADKILVCINYLENRRWSKTELSLIATLQSQAVFSVIVVRQSSLWRYKTLKRIFKPISLSGTVEVQKKPALLAIGGKAADVYNFSLPSIPILAIIPQFNEIDIIIPAIRHLLAQGIDVHIIDNWSTDGSYEAVSEFAESHPIRVKIERFPSKPTDKYEWGSILNRASQIALDNIDKYEWAMLNDADEIRWSPWEGITLQRALSFVNHLGYNSVDYTLFNFIPTKEGYKKGKDPKKFFRYGEFSRESWAFVQIKAWKNAYRVDLASSGSHHVNLPVPQMIFPIKFLLTHYPIRSTEHAKRKIFKERRPRFTDKERKKGWNTQYDDIEEKSQFIKDRRRLIKFNSNFFRRFLVERISGIGLRVD